ncbi:hypothetical protein [Caulobacter sp. DWR2-3-1b2]|uniref:hypothetical protein n=1 Tax=unclassified Caulobacter TaxID=2648921 RepID=UPI003CEA06AB
MIQSPLERLLVLAAASEMSASEFKNVVSIVQSVPAADIESLYRQIRNRIRHLDIILEDDDRGLSHISPISRDIVELIRDAAIPPREAAERIRFELLNAEMEGSGKITPFNQKEGLARWLERVSKAVGGGALLNAAIAALDSADRNERGWTLNRS